MKFRFFVALVLLSAPPGIRAQGPATKPPDVINVALEGKPWAVVIAAPGFVADFDGTKPDGRRYYFGNNKVSGVVLSVTLENTKSSATLDECRRSTKRRLEDNKEFHPEEASSREARGMAILEFTVPEVGGIPLRQRNLFACMPNENAYIDIHLSKVQYKPADEQLFAAVLDAISIGPALPRKAAASPEIMKLFEEGSRYFMERNYEKAIGPYQKALDMEKRSHQINKPLWYVLIDNLGMAYGISGNLGKAKEVFDYGISQDEDYPLFYYNLACTYAEMNKMELAMEYLKMAFDRKANIIPGESMPDPRTDDSFQRFMKNEAFRKLVDLLMSP